MPAKDRDGIHVSMPKDLKDQLTKEAARREMYISDLICEKIQHSYLQETQQQMDILRSYEAISRKLDHLEPMRGLVDILVNREKTETPAQSSISRQSPPWLDPEQWEAYQAFKQQWDTHLEPDPTNISVLHPLPRRRWWSLWMV